MQEQLQIENLTKRFGTVVANDQVKFNVLRGEIHCLFGENGAGKSTLAECITVPTDRKAEQYSLTERLWNLILRGMQFNLVSE